MLPFRSAVPSAVAVDGAVDVAAAAMDASDAMFAPAVAESCVAVVLSIFSLNGSETAITVTLVCDVGCYLIHRTVLFKGTFRRGHGMSY